MIAGPRGMGAGTRIAGIFLLLLPVLEAGCVRRGPSLPPFEPGADGASRLIAALEERSCPPTLAADLEIRLAFVAQDGAEDHKGTLYGALRAAWPDRIRLQARAGPFVSVLSAAAGPDSAYVSFPRQRRYWAGTSRRTTGGAGPAGLLQTALGVLCPAPILRDLQDVSLDRVGGDYLIRGRRAESEAPAWLEVRLRQRDLEIKDLRVRSGDGRQIMHAVFGGYRSLAGRKIPRRILAHLDQGAGSALEADLTLSNLRLDDHAGPDVYRIPRPAGSTVLTDDDLVKFLRQSVPE